MKKTILTTLALFICANAENLPNQQQNLNQPQVLEFEKVLKNSQDKKNLESSNLPIPPLETSSSGTDFNVIGTVIIGNNKFCYLIVDSNKFIKATLGSTIKNKKIEDITEYGITISEKSKTSYLPILTSQIQESDIVFSSRENNIKKQ